MLYYHTRTSLARVNVLEIVIFRLGPVQRHRLDTVHCRIVQEPSDRIHSRELDDRRHWQVLRLSTFQVSSSNLKKMKDKISNKKLIIRAMINLKIKLFVIFKHQLNKWDTSYLRFADSGLTNISSSRSSRRRTLWLVFGSATWRSSDSSLREQDGCRLWQPKLQLMRCW